MDEDYPARPEVLQSLPGWGDNCGSESSTLETDVCVWRYAPLVVHATQEEEESWYKISMTEQLFACFFLITNWSTVWSRCQIDKKGVSVSKKEWSVGEEED